MTHESPLIDPENGVRLCGGSRALYENMLRRFSLDQTVPRLKAALLDGDSREAFLQAHSLKGLSAQLAFCALHALSTELCDLLRGGGRLDPLTAQQQLDLLKDIHIRTLDAINAMCPPQAFDS